MNIQVMARIILTYGLLQGTVMFIYFYLKHTVAWFQLHTNIYMEASFKCFDTQTINYTNTEG